jgi:hypothetical protein
MIRAGLKARLIPPAITETQQKLLWDNARRFFKQT